MEKFYRNCPICNNLIIYTSKYNMKYAENNKSIILLKIIIKFVFKF